MPAGTGPELNRAAGTEDRGPDPDVCRAEADRLLVVGTHPHAEHLELVAPGDFAQQREVQRGLLVDWRNAHQADHWQAETIAAFADEPGALGRQDAGLLRFLAGVDLDQAGSPTTAVIHLLGEYLSQPRPIDA